jgi:hypothetical protein
MAGMVVQAQESRFDINECTKVTSLMVFDAFGKFIVWYAVDKLSRTD